jgi:putative ABC transport system substrate-binding protein
LVERLVSSPEELQAALEAIGTGEVGTYVASSDAMVDSQAQMIIDMARIKNLPTMFYQEDVTKHGGLSSYGANFFEVGVLAAKYVHRILAGASPGELPVEQMSTLSFVINLRTAREIHLAIPDSVLARADRLIE